METARARLPEGVAIWAPVELSWVLGKFFRRLRPAAVVLMELELWPNFLLTARRLGVPVLVANGRITERSARRYARLGPAARALFGCVDSYGAQSAACRDRFLRLGVEPARVELLGNLKHDQRPSPKAARAPETRAWLGWAPQATAVIVAGSTHPGEERALCALHARLSAHRPELRLVLAPRHVERLSDAEIESWAAARPIVRWSSIRDAKAPLPRRRHPPGRYRRRARALLRSGRSGLRGRQPRAPRRAQRVRASPPRASDPFGPSLPELSGGGRGPHERRGSLRCGGRALPSKPRPLGSSTTAGSAPTWGERPSRSHKGSVERSTDTSSGSAGDCAFICLRGLDKIPGFSR
jgi:hypothetical protein